MKFGNISDHTTFFHNDNKTEINLPFETEGKIIVDGQYFPNHQVLSLVIHDVSLRNEQCVLLNSHHNHSLTYCRE